MKFDKQKAFPYPVLRPYSDDYLEVDFQTMVDFSIEGASIEASIEYAISSEEILEQIENGNAEYVSIISCRDTYFRKVLRSQSRKVETAFNTGELRGEVRVDPFVFVKRSINGFTSPDFNGEFNGANFDFVPGDVLAQDESQVFYIDRDLFKPVTSVFELVKKESLPEHEWSLDFSQEHVQICLSPKMKEMIDNARNTIENRAILLNSIYFSAVMQSIDKLKYAADDFGGYKWAQVIRRQSSNLGVDIDAHDACVTAQRLMRYPLSYLDNYVFKGAE